MSRSRRSSASTRSIPRAWPTSTNGWRNISRCGPTRSKPWNTISMPGPPVRKRRERNDDEQALGRGRSALARETNGGLKMRRQVSRHTHQGGRIDVTTPHASRAGTLTFEGDFATITFERRIPHPAQVVWNALTESEHLALVHDDGPPRRTRRGEHRLPERPRPIPCHGEDTRVAADAGVRARAERRAPEGTPKGREEFCSLGAHP